MLSFYWLLLLRLLLSFDCIAKQRCNIQIYIRASFLFVVDDQGQDQIADYRDDYDWCEVEGS